MRVAYIRVSSAGQNLQSQKEVLERHQIDKWFIDEGKTGFNLNRQGFQSMLEFVRTDDKIIISDFSRMARSLSDLLETLKLLERKGVELISIHEGINTSTATGKMQIAILGAVSEFLSTLQKEKIREGIEVAKREGKYKGRKKKELKDFEEKYALYQSREIKNKVELAKSLGISRQKLYNIIAERGFK